MHNFLLRLVYILLITIFLHLCRACFLKWGDKIDVRYFGIKEVHRIEGAVPSLGSDMMLYNANTGELIALVDCGLDYNYAHRCRCSSLCKSTKKGRC